MRISELIAELEKVKVEHGDMVVGMTEDPSEYEVFVAHNVRVREARSPWENLEFGPGKFVLIEHVWE